MLIRIISLVFLLICLNTSPIYASDTNFIFPKNKPSVFKKITKKVPITENIIVPNKKPDLKHKLQSPDTSKEIPTKIKAKVAPKPKIVLENEKIAKDMSKTLKKIKQTKYLLPRDKPASYKVVKKTINKSKILNKKDFNYAKDVFKLINSGKWNSGLKLSERVRDKDFRDLVEWLYLKTTGNRATFDDYQKFIKRNPEYPRIGRLRYIAEHKIYLRNNTPSAIINWFDNYPAVSGMGKIKLAEAYFEQGKLDLAKPLLKQGWITADIRKNDLSYYRGKFKKLLNSDDHIKRADYLSWESKYWDLKRMLRYLPKDERALYKARQILMSNSYGVDNAISSVPDHLKKNIGLEYDRLKWRNRRGRLDQSLEILFENSNKTEEDLIRGDLWWKQRESVVRNLIYKKKYKTAYKVASEHSLTSGANFAEAEWLSGWIALTFLKSGEYAISHFQNFYNNVNYPISVARGAYWLGKSYENIGDVKISNEYYKQGSKYLTTYYGQLSFNKINQGKKFELIDQTSFTKEFEKEFNKNKLIKHVVLLKELGYTKFSKDIIKHLALLDVENGSEALAAQLATKIERYDYAIQISKKASYEKRFFNKYNYPIIATPREINKKNMPEAQLILAIIRQESEFDRKANSYVGAKGMMQLMKYTAKTVAKQAKLPYSISKLTSDPEYNIKLGSYYFNSLLDQYDGIYPFAIAAYNAGPNRVKTWRRVNGDPSKQQLSYIDWIELIRFKETRNYVQRVLENVNVYKYMLNQKPVNIDNFFK